jgi:hypothetical protein
MKELIKFYQTTLKYYQNTLSFILEILFGKGCRYEPTCSQYAYEAVAEYGILKGTGKSLIRIFKCNPFFAPGNDPVKTYQK